MGETGETGEKGETAGQLIWIDGALAPVTKAAISPFDHGLTVGDGVFETMKVTRAGDGPAEAFALTRHLARLRRSAHGLGLPVPISDDELRNAVRLVLDADTDAGRVRITLTGGSGPLGSERLAGAPTIVVASSTARPWPASAAVTTVPWRRNEHSAVAGLKTTSYAENVVALAYAREHGGSEAIFANTAGRLCEGTGSNVFVVVDDRLVTPPLSSGCLAGVTRDLLLSATDLAIEEADLPLDALTRATEVFITSSTRDVQPVHAIDGTPVPTCPGPSTTAALDAFHALEASSPDP
jgi:branched-chain amino acid aminotransferase